MFDLTPILQALIALFGTIITAYVIPYIKSKTTEAQRASMEKWIKTAVHAAEQIYAEPGKGADKLQCVTNILKERGITIDPGALETMIEAAVYELKKTGGDLNEERSH